MKLGKREGSEKAVSKRGKNPATRNFAKVELLVGSGALCVYVRANILLYFGFIGLILLCINQSLKTETEGNLNTVK